MNGPEIIDDYRDYSPPAWVRDTVRRLVDNLDASHVGGLQSIVLTNSARIGKGKTQRVRGRKYHARECRGFYNYATRNSGPWIQLVVDNIVRDRRPRFKFLQDVMVSRTLFHEIGHHLHETVGSAKRGGEESADDWSYRLLDLYLRRRYRLLTLFTRVVAFFLTPILLRKKT